MENPYLSREQWVNHALVCLTWIEQENITHLDAASLLHNAAYYLDDRARYSEAEPLYERALHISASRLGETHSLTQTIRANYQKFVQERSRRTKKRGPFSRWLRGKMS